jgi:hypothetical protein
LELLPMALEPLPLRRHRLLPLAAALASPLALELLPMALEPLPLRRHRLLPLAAALASPLALELLPMALELPAHLAPMKPQDFGLPRHPGPLLQPALVNLSSIPLSDFCATLRCKSGVSFRRLTLLASLARLSCSSQQKVLLIKLQAYLHAVLHLTFIPLNFQLLFALFTSRSSAV